VKRPRSGGAFCVGAALPRLESALRASFTANRIVRKSRSESISLQKRVPRSGILERQPNRAERSVERSKGRSDAVLEIEVDVTAAHYLILKTTTSSSPNIFFARERCYSLEPVKKKAHSDGATRSS
jgi:hypothetical protein